MTIEELKEHVFAQAKMFGVETSNEERRFNAIERVNINPKDSKDAPFFAFIRPEQPTSHAFSDFSFVVFPCRENSYFFVSLTVGSMGFDNDYELATLPGLRRMFLPLLSNDEYSFCKTSFADIENELDSLKSFVEIKQTGFIPMLTKYGKVIVTARFLDSQKDDDIKILDAWLAQYANLRCWDTNEKYKKAVQKTILSAVTEVKTNELDDILNVIEKRRFVVLQGAPGTGKTFMANKISKNYKYVFFEQFHAETTYSDFVYGIMPDINSSADGVKFVKKEGVLYKAIKCAIDNPDNRVLLIIDEINRANLANVLGPVFYLFEDDRKRNNQITIGEQKMTALPNNIDVIATMNTADRSLAVVDFALRRRFAWYTLRPHKLTDNDLDDGRRFYNEMFNKFDVIFKTYATDEELNLQPGQSYFIAHSDEEMNGKIEFELMPLIKEYLNEGYLLKAKDTFANLFHELVKKQLFE